MQELLNQLLTINLIYLAVGASVLTLLLKRLLNYCKLNVGFINKVILPSLPSLVGLVLGIITHQIWLGLIAGTFSSILYGRVKKFLKADI